MALTLTIHIFTAFFMTGLCWFVQLVHYPLFREIDSTLFPAYEKKNFVTAFVTVPVMTIELLTGIYLLYMSFSSIFITNMGLLAIIWLSTAIFQVPTHLKLSYAAPPERITKLIRTNWIRTMSWTLRSCLLAYLLLDHL